MPYDTIKDIPSHVKEKVKGNPNRELLLRQWIHVWMNTFERTKSESKAFEMANGILKDRLNEQLFKKMTNK